MLWYITIGIILSIDAVLVCTAYSVCFNKKDISIKLLPIFISVFHIIFPLIFGYAAKSVQVYVESYSKFIAATIFLFLGLMLMFSKKEDQICCRRTVFYALLLALGVSIDSIIVGISLGLSSVEHNILHASLIFGTISFTLSYLSLKYIRKINLKFDFKYISGGFFILLAIFALLEIL